ncbi:MAG: Carbamoyl-phosphate synthase large chain [Firmicutes bacterium]|nr:Carbamoyl-phosphate synthase large chain [Bacillota bacterium]MDI6705357.1 carbamoyl-phosphate synthase large subunit [Bacillota bacterium]
MPRDQRVKKALVIGSGPIIIGQAAEFDYSGTQACQALKEEGVEVVLVNSNPATIMTDQQVADRVYIEPLTIDFVERVIDRERPDSLLATMGGQTGLNIAMELAEKGILARYGVKLIGTSISSITMAEDREQFKKLMESIGQPVVESRIVTKVREGEEFARGVGYPVVVRPAYTLGGTGGGIAYNERELREILKQGLGLSRAGQAIVEKSIIGWREVEYEVMRDGKGNCITVCNMENIDPVGIHTGDSIVIAPSQTLTDKQYQMLRTASLTIIAALEIEGGCNIQFALHPQTDDYYVIEVNPRVSRSSALASKATGYPIAKVAAKIAVGYSLEEIENKVTGKTKACFEPTLDYVVIKMPRWPFDKFVEGERHLGTRMKATGEVMSISNTFQGALLKAIRSLDMGIYSLDIKRLRGMDIETIKKKLKKGDDERLFIVAQALKKGLSVGEVCGLTGIHPYFISKIKEIALYEEYLRGKRLEELTRDDILKAKKMGFSDKAIGELTGSSVTEVFRFRVDKEVLPVYKMVDTCGAEFEAVSPYYYSTYDSEDETLPDENRKIMVIGSGPIRIGQGIEFDYCSVHCVKALSGMGIETIIVNNNPETVSTDFDISDRLYFEPITEEDVLNIIWKEKPEGVILQFGGQTSIKLAGFMEKMGIKVLGTQPMYIDMAEDRKKMDRLLEELEIPRPEGIGVNSVQEGIAEGERLGYPLLIRPSYVLGGQGMQIVYNSHDLKGYLEFVYTYPQKHPVLIDRYLVGKEVEVDAICDGKDVLIPGIMEHLERAGVHSGDSISIYPPVNLTQQVKDTVVDYTRRIALAMKVQGIINIQYVVFENRVYVIEVNPRSSRTVPYISKVTGIPMVDIATRTALGESLSDMGIQGGLYPEASFVAVKVPVFSMDKLPDVETSLSPEMKSTGEVLGIGENLLQALYKGFMAAGVRIPQGGKVLASISNVCKEEFLPIAKELYGMGYELVGTLGTSEFLNREGIPCGRVNKIGTGSPDIMDRMDSAEFQLIINTPTKGKDSRTDGFKIRRKAVESSITCLTSIDTARALVDVMKYVSRLEEVKIFHLGELKNEAGR